MKNQIEQIIRDSISTKEELLKTQLSQIEKMALVWIECFQKKGKLMFCGNGGSAADSQHIATELMIRLKSNNNRPALAALALTTDTSMITAGANDLGYNEVFARQVEGLGRENDVLIAISTSGNSKSIIRAVEQAKKMNITTVGWLGNKGGALKDLVDFSVIVPHTDSGRIQESHIMIGHILSELAEKALYNL